MTKLSSRDRLLDAAADLFYREGVRVGVEALCKAAGVSKRSMYQLFDSKDDVVAAGLDRRAPSYQGMLVPVDDDRPPRARILHVFERLEELSGSAAYKGCPFVSVAFETKDAKHPAAVVARRNKDALTDFFRAEAARAGVADPELLAAQLTVAFDGGSARAVMRAEPLAGVALATATALLDNAGL